MAFFFLLRSHFLTPWKLYSDSYKFLLIAESFGKIRSPLEMFPQVNWPFETLLWPYKWLYPIIIAIFHKFSSLISLATTTESLAHSVNLISSSVIPLLIGAIIHKKTRNSLLTIISILLIGISGSQLIWSGFIVTEPLALSLILAYFLSEKTGFKFLFAVLMFLARPELIIIPIITILLSKITKTQVAKYAAITQLLTVGIITLLFAMTTYFTTYWQLDLLIFAAVITALAFIIFNKIKTIDLELTTTFITLSIIYLLFNPNIERYGVILIPLMLIAIFASFEKFELTKQLNSLSTKIAISVAIVVLASIQFSAVINYPIRTSQDYHSEIAEKALRYAIQNDYTKIVTYQVDPLLYTAYKYNSPVSVYAIEKLADIDEVYSEKWYNTLFLIDESAEYYDTKLDFTRLKLETSFYSQEPFKTNNETIPNAKVELWRTKLDLE